MIRGIHHASLTTENADRLVDFYCNVIGFTVAERLGWSGIEMVDRLIGLDNSATKGAMLRAGNCYLEIFQYLSPEPVIQNRLRPCDHGYTHICLDVVDIEFEYERLKAAGMVFNSEPKAFGSLWAVYGKDPDGNIVEIQETVPEQVFSLERLAAVNFNAIPE